MSSVETALAVDYARRGALIIPLMLLVMIFVPLWILGTLGADGALAASTKEGVVLHVTLTLVMGFVAAVTVIQAQGALARFFVRPISAARLVACQMLLGGVTIGMLYAIAVSLANLGGADWPVLGPALFLATTLVCVLAAIWSLEGSVVAQSIGCAATTVPLVIWFSRCYGARFIGNWSVMWRNPTAAESCTLIALSLAAYAVAVFGVARIRRGDVWDFAALQAWIERLHARGAAAGAFSSAQQAQGWYEWRAKFGPAPACLLAFATVLALAAWFTGFARGEDAVAFVFVMPLVLFMVVGPLLFGLIAGSCGQEGRPSMKHSLATRPVSDSFLAAAILRNCAQALIWSLAVWLVSLVLVGGLAYLAGESPFVDEAFAKFSWSDWRQVLLLLGVPLIAWTATALMATLSATGRQWLWMSLFFAAFGVGLVLYLIKIMVSPYIFEQVYAGWLLLSAFLCLAGTCVAFLIASKHGVVSTSTIAWSAGGWLLLALAAYYVVSAQVQDVVLILNCVGTLSLAFLPFAAMPLAIRWNRHR